MSKKNIFYALFLMAFMFLLSSKALAADGSYNKLRVGDYLNILRDYDHLDTGSRVYDNGQLHIATDDYLYLDASQRVYLQNEAYFTRNTDGWQGSQSRLYDNGQFHMATDDFLYIDVPDTVFISNNLKINGGLYFGEGTTADFSNAEVIGFAPFSTLSDEIEGKVSAAGDTMYGELNANGGIDINSGNFSIYSDGTSYIGGEMVLNGNAPLKVNATAFFYGGINIPSAGVIISPDGGDIYTNGFSYPASGIVTSGLVDFSGATMTRVTNAANEPTCAANASGAIYFNTTDTLFYGCDGSSWRPMTEPVIPE